MSRSSALSGVAVRPAEAGDAGLRGGDDVLGGEAELAEQRLVVGARRRSARWTRSRPASPTQRYHGMRDARPRPRPAPSPRAAAPSRGRPASCSSNHSRHGIDTTRVAMPSASQQLAGLDGDLHLRAGADQDHLRRRRRTRRRARSRPGDALGARCPSQDGDVLPGQRQALPGRVGASPGSPSRRTRSRSRRRGARSRGPGSRAARPGARSAGGSGRPRRGRWSRGSTRRSTGAFISAASRTAPRM